jgi:hypothetical protein
MQTDHKSCSADVEADWEGLNMTEKDVEGTLEILRWQYSEGAITRAGLPGLDFPDATFDCQSTHQSTDPTLRSGPNISITHSGLDHETHPTIKAVIKSIKLRERQFCGRSAS